MPLLTPFPMSLCRTSLINSNTGQGFTLTLTLTFLIIINTQRTWKPFISSHSTLTHPSVNHPVTRAQKREGTKKHDEKYKFKKDNHFYYTPQASVLLVWMYACKFSGFSTLYSCVWLVVRFPPYPMMQIHLTMFLNSWQWINNCMLINECIIIT